MTLRHLRWAAFVAALCGGAVPAFGHPTPYGDTYTFSGENFPNNFGVVKEPETGEIFTYPTPAYTLTFDGIAETAGEMIVNERAVVWPGKTGLMATNAAGIDGQTTFELTDWYNSGEVLEFAFDTVDGGWISESPAANSSFTLAGVDWLHAAAGDSPFFFEQGFYFYWTNNGVPLDDMTFVMPDVGVLVGEHPFDPSVPQVAYIAYSRGQVDDVTDEYEGGTNINGGTRQLDANASWALLQQVLSLPPASGNGFRLGYLVDIDTVIDETSGDFNNDGVVTTADYDILRTNFRQDGGFTEGDINFDGTVDLADFIDFKESYQLANGVPLQSVPEPSTFALAALLLGGAMAVRQRRQLRRGIAGAAVLAGLMAQNAPVEAQFNYLWQPPGPTAANWNVATNWDPALVPSQPLGGAEFGVITNGGRAYIDGNNGAGTPPAAGVILGRDQGTTGALEIRSGGHFEVVQDFSQYGTAEIGQNGTGVLDVLDGGSFSPFSLTLAGEAGSQLNASGTSSIVVASAANLSRTTKISGPNVTFTTPSLTMTGTLVADITSATHSPIVATDASLIFPTLKVQFSGHTPAYGEEYALIDGTTLSGKFSSVDTTAAPELAPGLEYRVAYSPNADVSLKVDNTLVLTVDPDTGAANIGNVVGGAIDFDGYSILSAGGLLDGAFTGLGATDTDWLSAAPTPTALSELNLLGATSVNVGASLSLGSLFSGAVDEGDLDLIFEYTSNGELRQGIVAYGDISAPGQVGDTDNDGDVDLDDLNAVRNNFGGTGNPGSTPGDAYPFDGIVDLDDLNGVRNNFGAGPTAAVPEPATWALGALGSIALLGLARRRAK